MGAKNVKQEGVVSRRI